MLVIFQRFLQKFLLTWYEKRSKVPPFQIRSPMQFKSHSNSGLQGYSFQPLNIAYDPLKQS